GVKPKPVLYIMGDSTVRNGDGKGGNGQGGWGTLLPAFFDTGRLQIQNHAIGGRSSRTFITEGRWERILSTLKKGDYVLMQFGHNDAGPLDDTARARGTIRGIGPETQEIYNPIQKRQEVVHTYGWYMRKYVREAKEKGAIPIICSPVPRNNWQNGKIRRATADYGSWASQVAQQTNAYFIDLNESIAREYEKMDTASVSKLFYGDHTHTSLAGAQLNAQQVAKGIAGFKKLKLRKYLLK
ncbi:MAG TPA: rhamnogalacturonan acetylesterase, partial [Phnomibacter sp.]|nr:rhamnogalacturonan acetylesterase [Phnomibacter sp.]